MHAATHTRVSCPNPEDGALITESVHKATQQDIDTAVAAARYARTRPSQCGPSAFSSSPT